MTMFQLGSNGLEVREIQTRLRELGFYGGPVDGDFGGGTESAVKTFQHANGLEVDGRVGPITWSALVPGTVLERPAILDAPIGERCLALTGSFETGLQPPDCFTGLSGDFDGQGISLGVCQWNFGQRSLQPLLKEMDESHPDVVVLVFHDRSAEFRAVLTESLAAQLDWCRSIQDAQNRVREPWRGLLKTLCRRPEFQTIQATHAQGLLTAARALCGDLGVRSQRALALLFDIKVQNGGIGQIVEAQIHSDFGSLSEAPGTPEHEIARLRIIANRRAEAANPKWVEDVRARKLTIANGSGVVHGTTYLLAEQFGIGLDPA